MLLLYSHIHVNCNDQFQYKSHHFVLCARYAFIYIFFYFIIENTNSNIFCHRYFLKLIYFVLLMMNNFFFSINSLNTWLYVTLRSFYEFFFPLKMNFYIKNFKSKVFKIICILKINFYSKFRIIIFILS